MTTEWLLVCGGMFFDIIEMNGQEANFIIDAPWYTLHSLISQCFNDENKGFHSDKLLGNCTSKVGISDLCVSRGFPGSE